MKPLHAIMQPLHASMQSYLFQNSPEQMDHHKENALYRRQLAESPLPSLQNCRRLSRAFTTLHSCEALVRP